MAFAKESSYVGIATFRAPLDININGQSATSTVISPYVSFFPKLKLGADIYGSLHQSRTEKNSYAMVLRAVTDEQTEKVWPGQIFAFFEHTQIIPSKGSKTHKLAIIRFFRSHPHRSHFIVDQPSPEFIWHTELWSKQMEDPVVVPVHKLVGRFVAGSYHYRHEDGRVENCLVVSPFTRKLYI